MSFLCRNVSTTTDLSSSTEYTTTTEAPTTTTNATMTTGKKRCTLYNSPMHLKDPSPKFSDDMEIRIKKEISMI
jgi:hypothetical protein